MAPCRSAQITLVHVCCILTDCWAWQEMLWLHVFAEISEGSDRNMGTPLSQKRKQRHREVKKGGCGMSSRAGGDSDVSDVTDR